MHLTCPNRALSKHTSAHIQVWVYAHGSILLWFQSHAEMWRPLFQALQLSWTTEAPPCLSPYNPSWCHTCFRASESFRSSPPSPCVKVWTGDLGGVEHGHQHSTPKLLSGHICTFCLCLSPVCAYLLSVSISCLPQSNTDVLTSAS